MSIRESRYGRLVGHFFAGFMDNDLLMSSGAGLETALSQAIGLIAAPGLFYSLLMVFKYSALYYPDRETLTWDDKMLFVTFTMILTGLVTVIEWDALFPDRRDFQVLMPLPLTARLLFLAKVSSVLLLLLIFWAAANLGPAVVFPSVVLTVQSSWFEFGRFFAAHVIATLAASAFVFLFLIAVQGILMNLLSPRWFRRASLYVQLLVVLALVVAFMLMPLLMFFLPRWVRGNDPMMYAFPPFWFFGMYQALLGHGGPVFPPLASTGAGALAGAAAVSGLAYWTSYRRHVRKSNETLEGGRSGPALLTRVLDAFLNRVVLGHPLERACFQFVRLTLLRSRLHRLLLAAYIAVGFALVEGGTSMLLRHVSAGRPTPMLLSVQLVLSFFIVAGMRFAFTIPAELRANWIFQAAEPAGTERCWKGAWKAMLAFAAFPVLLGLFPLHAYLWGWRVAGAHLIYGGILSALLVEVLLVKFDKIPFTCTYLPGKANVKALWPVYLVIYWTYAYTMSAHEYKLLARPLGLAAFCLGSIAVIAALRLYSRRQFKPGFRLLFEELPEPEVRTLNISH